MSKDKINHKALLNELAIRCQYTLPKNEKELKWSEEGTDVKKCPNLLSQVLKATEGIYYL